MILQKWENNGTEEIGLITPTPGAHPVSEPLQTQLTKAYIGTIRERYLFDMRVFGRLSRIFYT